MFRYQFDISHAGAENEVGSSHNLDESAFRARLSVLRKEIIGSNSVHTRIHSPLDQAYRDIVYADYTASGRSVGKIEDFIRERVLPVYGNTHSVSSGTARQSTYFREESRHIISNYFNCTEENSVVFTGAGVTGAFAKFLALMEAGVREGFLFDHYHPSIDDRLYMKEDRWGSYMCTLCNVRLKNEGMFRSHCHSGLHQSRVVGSSIEFSPMEEVIVKNKVLFVVDHMSHHSILLPVRELVNRNPDVCDLLVLSPEGLISFCVEDLSKRFVNEVPKIIAVMCGMSNITGFGPSRDLIVKTNEAVHSIGGIISWDLATFVCHKPFDMNPPNAIAGYTDFAFVSVHKLLGGPGSSGLLLARKRWMKNRVPTVPGGGVVFFASAEEQSYIQNSSEREEAGTPDILGCIRAGLVFVLHQQLGMSLLETRERELSSILWSRLRSPMDSGKLVVLGASAGGATTGQVSPIVSFNVCVNPSTQGSHYTRLHHNFGVALLNDLFGIQARGGCACAGPYAQSLLGLSSEESARIHRCLQQTGCEIFRPGFVRVGVHWSMTEEEVDLIGNAIAWIAQHGHKLLPLYKVDVVTGEWQHKKHHHEAERDWLSRVDFWANRSDEKSYNESFSTKQETHYTVPIGSLIDRANALLVKVPTESVPPTQNLIDAEFSDLFWFAMPYDKFDDTVESADFVRLGITDTVVNHSSVDEKAIPPIKKLKKSTSVLAVPRKLRAWATQAIVDYSMIKPGDKVLVGVSGGKDSLTLLHILLDCQRKCPFKFEVGAATVDPQVPEYQPHPLKEYMQSIGVQYHYLSQPIVEIAKTAMTGTKQSICAFCSRMKRGMLYSCMRSNGYNVLALGQHLDDLVESFLMSCFRNGSLRTMKANYFVKEKDLRVIRPLVYVRERMTADFAQTANLPVIRENCPACFAAPKERHRIKLLLSKEEFDNPQLFSSMLQAMKPVMAITSAMSTKEMVEKKLFPFRNIIDDEDDDIGAETVLQPCGTADGSESCPIMKKM